MQSYSFNIRPKLYHRKWRVTLPVQLYDTIR